MKTAIVLSLVLASAALDVDAQVPYIVGTWQLNVAASRFPGPPPRMHIRSSFYGADEFFEIQGTDGWIWVTRYTGEMLDLPPVMLYSPDGSTTGYADLDADWGTGFVESARHFVSAILDGATTADMDGDLAVQTLQLIFAVYQASEERRPVDPSTIEGSVSPSWWPPTFGG